MLPIPVTKATFHKNITHPGGCVCLLPGSSFKKLNEGLKAAQSMQNKHFSPIIRTSFSASLSSVTKLNVSTLLGVRKLVLKRDR